MIKAFISLLSFITGWKKKNKPEFGAPDFSKEVPPEERIH